MQSINGYQYNTETEVINAQQACNTYYNIPTTPDSVTQNWVGYHFAELNSPQFWYIIYDESLVPTLGQPHQFEIIQPNL
jgi:hypothetical protein